MPEEIPATIRTFIAEQIESVAQLELILLLQKHPDQRWTAEAAAREFGLSPDMAAQLLNDLKRRGLASSNETEYRYTPKSPEWDQLVGQLADLYQERRVTVIQLIYAQPVDKLRSFAEAFKFRKDREEH